uniref:Uncharacterized protein n=1 Tax=Otus sunia TaxID=257818 RepID=A0A8C8AM56_9STRI
MNFFDFPSFSVGPCMIIHFPETAGKNTMPAARSYSSRCSQTAMIRGGKKRRNQCSSNIKTVYSLRTENGTYIDQSKVVFIDWKLLWANVFFQSRGIGAL